MMNPRRPLSCLEAGDEGNQSGGPARTACALSRAAETFLMSEELQKAAAWLAEGHKVALGTVIKTWGSAPRPAGSQIAVRGDGAFLGSVSGGCVEGAVIEAALADHRRRQKPRAGIRRHRCAGLGGGAGLWRPHPDLRRAGRRMKRDNPRSLTAQTRQGLGARARPRRPGRKTDRSVHGRIPALGSGGAGRRPRRHQRRSRDRRPHLVSGGAQSAPGTGAGGRGPYRPTAGGDGARLAGYAVR